MKLTDYIEGKYDGFVSHFASKEGYHLTQVNRCLAQGGLIDEDGKPYFKKYLNKKESSK